MKRSPTARRRNVTNRNRTQAMRLARSARARRDAQWRRLLRKTAAVEAPTDDEAATRRWRLRPISTAAWSAAARSVLAAAQRGGLLLVALAIPVLLGCGVEGRHERASQQEDAVFRELRTFAESAERTPAPAPTTPFAWPRGETVRVEIEVEGYGAITAELYPKLAPATVANFVELAGQGFYAGTTFHRIIDGFVIQGGDPNSRDDDAHNDGQGGPGHIVPDEFSDAPIERGVLAMANTGAPNSGGSQFFVALADRPELFRRYSVFGRVTAGMEFVDAIARVETDRSGRWGPKDRPVDDVVIAGIRVQSASDTLAASTPTR